MIELNNILIQRHIHIKSFIKIKDIEVTDDLELIIIYDEPYKPNCKFIYNTTNEDDLINLYLNFYKNKVTTGVMHYLISPELITDQKLIKNWNDIFNSEPSTTFEDNTCYFTYRDINYKERSIRSHHLNKKTKSTGQTTELYKEVQSYFQKNEETLSDLYDPKIITTKMVTNTNQLAKKGGAYKKYRIDYKDIYRKLENKELEYARKLNKIGETTPVTYVRRYR